MGEENEELEDLEGIPELDVDTILKRVKISYDGRQFMIRIPREIAEFYKLKKKDIIEMSIKISGGSPSRDIPMMIRVTGGNP